MARRAARTRGAGASWDSKSGMHGVVRVPSIIKPDAPRTALEIMSNRDVAFFGQAVPEPLESPKPFRRPALPVSSHKLEGSMARIFVGIAWPYANGPFHIGHLAGA